MTVNGNWWWQWWLLCHYVAAVARCYWLHVSKRTVSRLDSLTLWLWNNALRLCFWRHESQYPIEQLLQYDWAYSSATLTPQVHDTQYRNSWRRLQASISTLLYSISALLAYGARCNWLSEWWWWQQHLYSAIKSAATEALVASGSDCVNRWVLRCRLKVSTVRQDLTSDCSESKCAEPRPKKTDARTQFTFLGRSAAGRRMTAEDDAWLAASGATWEVVWRLFDLVAGRLPWLGCSALAAVHRKCSESGSRNRFQFHLLVFPSRS